MLIITENSYGEHQSIHSIEFIRLFPSHILRIVLVFQFDVLNMQVFNRCVLLLFYFVVSVSWVETVRADPIAFNYGYSSVNIM